MYIKQFIQPDSLIPNIYNLMGLNCDTYVLNNLYKYVERILSSSSKLFIYHFLIVKIERFINLYRYFLMC